MELSRVIDRTILKADASKEAVIQIIEETKKYRFYPVCTNPAWVALAKEQLQNESVAVYTVTRFPLGADTPEVKASETTDAINNGIDEVDMVTNIGTLKSKGGQRVQEDIEAVVEATKDRAFIEVITEASLLDREKIIRTCEIARAAGVDLVKTSTGLSTDGAKVEDVRLMHETVGPEMGVKASGGIHNEEEVMVMIEAGAIRIGASTRVTVVSGSAGEGY